MALFWGWRNPNACLKSEELVNCPAEERPKRTAELSYRATEVLM